MDKYDFMVNFLEKYLPPMYFYRREPIERYKNLSNKLKEASLMIYEVMKNEGETNEDIAVTIYKAIIFDITPWHIPNKYCAKFGALSTTQLHYED